MNFFFIKFNRDTLCPQKFIKKFNKKMMDITFRRNFMSFFFLGNNHSTKFIHIFTSQNYGFVFLLKKKAPFKEDIELAKKIIFGTHLYCWK